MEEEKKNRPDLLTALCALTFTGSTAGFLGYFVAALFFEKTSEIIIKYSDRHSVEDLSPLYFTLIMALMAVSLTGAIRMWKLHRDGFFVYAFAQLGIMFLPVIWIGWPAFSDTNAVFTVVFFTGYALNFRYLK